MKWFHVTTTTTFVVVFLLPGAWSTRHADGRSNSSTTSWSSLHRNHCPSCQQGFSPSGDSPLFQPASPANATVALTADAARLDSIKRQILVKLGLNAKPNLTTVPPRDFILETLLRAEESVNPYGHISTTARSRSKPPTIDATDAVDGAVEDEFYGKTSEIIAFAEPGPKLNGQVLAEFSRPPEMTSTEPSLRVKSATLWLYVQLSSSTHQQHRHQRVHPSTGAVSSKRPPTLYIFRILHSQQHRANTSAITLDQHGNKNWHELLVTQRVTLQHSGWIKLNVTEGVGKWFSTAHQPHKLRLLVDCSGCGSHFEPILFGTVRAGSGANGTVVVVQQTENNGRRRKRREQQPERHRPFLVIHTDSTNSRRLRRRTPLDCSPTTHQCCKQRFFVSFKALGWDDWIIAPSGYYANYCRGDCGGGPNGPLRTPDTFLNYHSHVMQQVRNKMSPSEVQHQHQHQQQQQQHVFNLQPCCAPTKFSSMSLIYFGPDMSIIKRDLPKMVVDECGCP